VNSSKAKIQINPKKLLLSKWTAVHPARKEKHYLVCKVIAPEAPSEKIEWVELEAIYSGRVTRLAWQELRDPSSWLQGWK